MWARIVECMLGCWLLMSPFIFAHGEEQRALWINDLAAGSTLLVVSLACYWHPTAWAHWLFIPLGAWLVAFGRFWEPTIPLEPGYQNEVMVGLLLVMFAVIPNEASQPPRAWRTRPDDFDLASERS